MAVFVFAALGEGDADIIRVDWCDWRPTERRRSATLNLSSSSATAYS